VIESWETEIRCDWTSVDGRMEGDEACERIRQLSDSYLIELGRDWSGWETLYADPADSRLWERTYPQGEMHGGGPPLLRVIEEREAREKYGEAAVWPRK
jgi:hypothetical protein